MEMVIFPQNIAPVIQPDRVKRAKSRGDSGKGSPFSKQLRQEKDAFSNSKSPPQEDAELPPAALVSAEVGAVGGGSILPQTQRDRLSGKKLIDVRV